MSKRVIKLRAVQEMLDEERLYNQFANFLKPFSAARVQTGSLDFMEWKSKSRS